MADCTASREPCAQTEMHNCLPNCLSPQRNGGTGSLAMKCTVRMPAAASFAYPLVFCVFACSVLFLLSSPMSPRMHNLRKCMFTALPRCHDPSKLNKTQRIAFCCISAARKTCTASGFKPQLSHTGEDGHERRLFPAGSFSFYRSWSDKCLSVALPRSKVVHFARQLGLLPSSP